MKRFVYILIFSLIAFSALSQSKFQKKGDKAYKENLYATAREYYEKTLAEARSEGDNQLASYASFKIAECYYRANNYERAIPFYQTADALNYRDSSQVFYRHYGEMLMMLGDYHQAREMFKRQLKLNTADETIRSYIKACTFADTAKTKESIYDIINAQQINTRNSDFATTPFRNKIVFTTSRFGSDSLVYSYTGEGFEDLYETYYNIDQNSWAPPTKLQGGINSSYNEGTFTFDTHNGVAYFMQCNGKDGAEKNCNIFCSKYNESKNSWGKQEQFKYQSTEYSSGHPAITPDGLTLYFVSNNPAGMGGTDIWFCKLDTVTFEWGEPQNAGNQINTPGNEMFPYVSNNDGLYFSSNGRQGYGGLDIYYAPKVGANFSQPINLRPPFNSSADDFSLMYLEENCGVFSSNRIGGVGSDDIYLFKLKDVNIEVVGRVLSFSKPVADAIVIIKDVETEAVDTLITDSLGIYHYPAMEKDKQYKIFAYKDDYLIPTGKLINTQGVTKSITMDSKHGYEMDFDMRKIEQNKEYEIRDIYYDVDKYEFRPEYLDELENLVSLLNNNPEICIQVNSHTDERASDIYNLILSNNRAKAVVDFLNSRGVDMNRLTWKGWGETSPIYPNATTEDEHQANRRTTFTIINFEQLQLAKKAEEHNETVRKVERAGKQEPKENGLYFRVQIAAMTNKNNTLFKKVNKNMPGVPTYCSKDSDGLYKYTVGMFTTFQEASFMKDEIDNLGYNSFIVAYENGNRLPINEVIQLQLKEKK